MKNKKWHKPRHTFWGRLAMPFLYMYLKSRQGYIRHKNTLPKGPGLILSNHLTDYDPFVLGLDANQIIYFVLTSDAFSNKFTGGLIRHTIQPIPKTKEINDLACVKNMLTVLKEGYKVGVFPEGNRSFSGELGFIDDAMSKFIKKAMVPVYIYNIKGGYAAYPRYAKCSRKSKLEGELKYVLTPNEIEKMSVDEIQALIIKELTCDPKIYPIGDKAKNIAEYMESTAFYCPECGRFETLYSKEDELICKECGYTLKYNHDLSFSLIKGTKEIKDMVELYHSGIDALNSNNLDALEFKDNECEVILADPKKGLCPINKNASISINKNRILLDTIEIPLDKITSSSIFSKNRLTIHTEDLTYVVRSNPRFNALKYHMFIHRERNIRLKRDTKYLGI